jgi:hypothetical protein
MIDIFKELKSEKKENCKVNGYDNIKNTCNYLLEVLEDKKYYNHYNKMQFSINAKLCKSHHFADSEDCKNVIIDILKNQYNVNKDYEKVFNLLNISDEEIMDLHNYWIEDNQGYIKEILSDSVIYDETEIKEILSIIKNDSIGFYGRSGGNLCFNTDIDFNEELETIIHWIDEDYIKYEYDYNRLQSDVKEWFNCIMGLKFVLDDIKTLIDGSSFHDELKFRYEIEIEDNTEIQEIIINECKQLNLDII